MWWKEESENSQFQNMWNCILNFRENKTEALFQKANMKKDIKFRDVSVLNL